MNQLHSGVWDSCQALEKSYENYIDWLICKVCFGKAGHAYDMNKIGQLLVDIGQIKNKSSPSSMKIWNYWGTKMPNKIQNGHCVRVPYVITV